MIHESRIHKSYSDVTVKLSKYVKISMEIQIPFYRKFFKSKENQDYIPGHIEDLVEIFDKNFYFVILCKLTKFHCKTMSTSQVVY